MGVALVMAVQAEPPFGLSFRDCRKLLLYYSQTGTRQCVVLIMMEEASWRQSRHTCRQSWENCRDRDRVPINPKAALPQHFSVMLGARTIITIVVRAV